MIIQENRQGNKSMIKFILLNHRDLSFFILIRKKKDKILEIENLQSIKYIEFCNH